MVKIGKCPMHDAYEWSHNTSWIAIPIGANPHPTVGTLLLTSTGSSEQYKNTKFFWYAFS